METLRKVVLVASATSPDRAIAIERLLASAAACSGWGERLEIRVGGIEDGVGRPGKAVLAALGAAGIDAQGCDCPDLRHRPDLLDGAEIVVCDLGGAADTLIDWDAAAEAVFVVMDEIGARPVDDEDAREAPVGVDLGAYAANIDEVLRRVVAGVLTD